MLRQNWIAASENLQLQQGLPFGAASHGIPGSSQIESVRRDFSAAL